MTKTIVPGDAGERLLELLEKSRGVRRPVKELEIAVGIDDPDPTGVVLRLQVITPLQLAGHLIVTNTHGVKLADSTDDVNEFLSHLRSRVREIVKKIRVVEQRRDEVFGSTGLLFDDREDGGEHGA